MNGGNRTHLLRLLGLTILALVYFHELWLAPGTVLYSPHSDMLSMHVPKKQFLVRHFAAEGELPLWCPAEFCGAPFLHDIQVAAFYPPHALLYCCDETRVGVILSWLVVAHVIVCGWLTYGYACHERLRPDAACVAAIGAMFAGKWLLHLLAAGHYILVGLAWLPGMFWLMSRAIRRESLTDATAAGILFALLILGTHPQWTFYAGLLAGLWSLGAALERAGWFGGDAAPAASLRRSLATWLLVGGGTVLVGALLSAAQLLPTLEATGYANRSISGVTEGVGIKGILGTWAMLIGPGLSHLTSLGVKGTGWELRGNLSPLWLAIACTAPIFAGRKGAFYAALTLLVIAFSAGLGDLVQAWPGFRLFRLPSRMATFLAVPLGFLAGQATQALFDGRFREPRARAQALVAASLATVVVGLLALADIFIGQRLFPNAPLHRYWWLLAGLVPAALLLTLLASSSPGRGFRFAWLAVLGIDLLALSWPLVEVEHESRIYGPPEVVRYLAKQMQPGERLLDRDRVDKGMIGERTSPIGTIQPLLHDFSTVLGYNPLSIQRYRLFVHFISHYDRLPRADDVGILAFPILNRKLVDLAGIRYLIQPANPAYLPADKPPIDETQGWTRVFRDESPEAYVFSGPGLMLVGPHNVWRNEQAYPRAFLVGRAVPTPPRETVLQRLPETDFQQVVWVEGLAAAEEQAAFTGLRPASIAKYAPNEVAIEYDSPEEGWLVLTDTWYPGWNCVVDGQTLEVRPGDYAFRAVRVPAGKHLATFRFEPPSVPRGRTVTLAGLGVCGLVFAGAGMRRWRKKLASGGG